VHNVSRVAGLHDGISTEQVRVTSIAPAIDCGEIEIAGRRVGLWKSPRDQVRQRRLQLGARLTEPAGSHLERDIARLDAKAHR
jgi:hypothetical protein